MKNAKKLVVGLLLIVACLFITSSAFAQAAEQSIVVYPAVTELDVTPGELTRFTIQFRNNGKIPVAGSIKISDFTVKDKEGTPIILEDEKDKPPYAASSWITANANQITIPSNDFVAVYFNAQVPPVVKTCGNYALVYFENEATSPVGAAKTTSSSSSITTKIGALVNFTVKNKECKEKALISSLRLPMFSEYGPVKATFEIINNGDYHIAPTGVTYLLDMFNKKTDEQKIIEKRIFPGVLKEYQINLGKQWMIGRYQLVINGKYGLNGLPITASTYFWVFPWKLAIIILLAIILIWLLAKNYLDKTVAKEKVLEEEIESEKEEIQRLKEQLRKRE